MSGKRLRVSISERALLARINRKLAHKGEKLCRSRGPQEQSEMGSCYIVNVQRGRIVARHVDPERLAKELGVLKPYEQARRA